MQPLLGEIDLVYTVQCDKYRTVDKFSPLSPLLILRGLVQAAAKGECTRQPVPNDRKTPRKWWHMWKRRKTGFRLLEPPQHQAGRRPVTHRTLFHNYGGQQQRQGDENIRLGRSHSSQRRNRYICRHMQPVFSVRNFYLVTTHEVLLQHLSLPFYRKEEITRLWKYLFRSR